MFLRDKRGYVEPFGASILYEQIIQVHVKEEGDEESRSRKRLPTLVGEVPSQCLMESGRSPPVIV